MMTKLICTGIKQLGRYMLGLAVFLTGASGVAWADCPEGLSITKPSSIYTVNADNTITDRQTGLVWDRCTLGRSGTSCSAGASTEYSWLGALEAVQAANTGNHLGYNDWRLPNVKELYTLVEVGCYWPAINTDVFPLTAWIAFGYWTSTVEPAGYADDRAWVIDFDEGKLDVFYKNEQADLYVRLVRGG